MTRNHPKVLGLALVAVFALSAVAAAAASAEEAEFTAGVGATETAGIDGTQTEAFGDTLSIGGKPLSCEEATLGGEALEAGPASREVTLTPTYGNCHAIIAGLTFPATVTTNSCHYRFSATSSGAPPPYVADLHIECDAPGDQIEIHVYANKAKHEADEPLCTYDIEPQAVTSGFKLENHESAPDDVIAQIENAPVVVKNTKPSATCSNEEEPPSTYNGEDTLQATDEGGELVNASVSSPGPAEFTAGVGATETAGIDGTQTEAFGDTLSIGGKPLSCEEATLGGEALEAGPASREVTLTPTYGNCHAIIAGLTFPATVTTNSCHYRFSATSSGAPPPYVADLHIECDAPGDQIEIHVYANKAKHEADEPLCTYDIEPQAVTSGFKLENHESAPDDVIAQIENAPVVVKNTKPSATCSNEEEPPSTYNGEDTLQATDEGGELVNASVSSPGPAEFTAGVGATETAGIDGTQTEAFGDTLSIGGKPLSCEEATLGGEALEAGPASREVTLTPTYGNCHAIIAGLTFPATVTTNSCHYRFSATSSGAPPPYVADLHIECDAPGDQIEIHVYANKAKHEADEPLCTYDIEPQAVTSGFKLENHESAPDDVIAQIENAPVVVKNTKPSATCSNEEEPPSTYNGEDTLQATDEGGELVNASVS